MSACAMEQAASSAVGRSWRGEIRLFGLMARLRHRGRNAILYFGCGIVGEGMAEILHDVEPVSAADHAQPDHVVSRVEQVGAMRRGKHQMLLGVRGVEIERDILAFLIELRASCSCQALRQRGLTFELMRKLTRRKHCLRVSACGAAQARHRV